MSPPASGRGTTRKKKKKSIPQDVCQGKKQGGFSIAEPPEPVINKPESLSWLNATRNENIANLYRRVGHIGGKQPCPALRKKKNADSTTGGQKGKEGRG